MHQRSLISVISTIIGSAALIGCESGGLSSREGGARSQGSYLTALTDDVAINGTARRSAFVAPGSLAVAQIGEVSPPESMMAALRDDKTLFRSVQAIPATAATLSDDGLTRGRYSQSEVNAETARRGITSLRNLAAASGADYLLLVGGTVDQTSRTTPLSVLNLTIVGMFIVPSQQTRALMKASGAMIDVKTGHIVTLSSADREETRWMTYASQEGESMEMLGSMRDEVTAKLAKQVINDCRQSTTATATATPSLPATASR